MLERVYYNQVRISARTEPEARISSLLNVSTLGEEQDMSYAREFLYWRGRSLVSHHREALWGTTTQGSKYRTETARG